MENKTFSKTLLGFCILLYVDLKDKSRYLRITRGTTFDLRLNWGGSFPLINTMKPITKEVK